MKVAVLLALFVGVGFLSGCTETYVSVPPNYLGAKLTPSGFEEKIYTPGQVDIGKAETSGQQNVLVLVQRSGLEVKEAFICEDEQCKQDHRVATFDKTPLTVDVRMLLALPDHTSKDGAKDLLRVFHLGNPKRTQENARVSVIQAQDIYSEQARLLVRGMIRQLFASYQNYDKVWEAFGAEGEENLSSKMQEKVIAILKEQKVPLRIIGVQVSNMKADASVVAANIQVKAVDSQIEAITKMMNFLNENPAAREVYKYSMIKDIVSAGAEHGTHTMWMTDLPSMSHTPLPIPVPK